MRMGCANAKEGGTGILAYVHFLVNPSRDTGKNACATIFLFLLSYALNTRFCFAQDQDEFLTDIAPYAGNVILARPTDHSMTLSVMSAAPTTVRVDYGQSGAALDRHTPSIKLAANEPREIVLDHLAGNSAYEYRVVDAASNQPIFPEKSNGTFHTQRSKGQPFTFTIQADSHLDGGCRPDVYKLCLANALADKPDFHVDLGDTFMTGKHPTRESAARQYLAQRYYFGLIGHSAPVFLVIGNHDGEEAKKRGATDVDVLGIWSAGQRKRFFANPFPDSFYSGDQQQYPPVGLLEDYYAFTWGDAQFVMLNPYWTSTSARGNAGGWNMSLGRTQIDWLAKTLGASRAKYKFVFIHQLVGGLDNAGRGGAEAAALFEWGGQEIDGKETFAEHRSNWPGPISKLLSANHVTAVFHGHDHFYARQEKDGIIYQLVPQPGHRNFVKTTADEYGYKTGQFIPSSGHLRVRVAPEAVDVDYVRAAAPEMARRDVYNGDIAAHYRISAR